MHGLRRSEAGKAALTARYYAGIWARIGQEKAERTKMATNGTALKREKVEFPPNETITVAVKYAQPRIGQSPSGDDYALFTTTDDRVMFLDCEVARQITQLGIRPGQPFCIRMVWSGKRTDPRIYHVSLPGAAAAPSYGNQGNGTFAVPTAPPSSPAPAAASNGKPESELEFQLRKSQEFEDMKRKLAELEAGKKKAEAVPPAAAPHIAGANGKPQQQGQYNGQGQAWQEITLQVGQELIGLYAGALSWARQQHSDVRPEDVRALLTTAFIQTRRNG